ncbi:MAG TPA: metallophosphoesterase, partial [Cyclobacteriaceae bacterium]|nr:metallophosphoesterase [Cyclobacteriaceae bacterium]
MKILHLSDLHFNKENISQDIVLMSLLKTVVEIGKKQQKFDALLLTGDLSFSGLEAEYGRASEFISKLVEECISTRENVFIIPG